MLTGANAVDDMLRLLLISILGCFLVANNTSGLTFDDLAELFEGVQGSPSRSGAALRKSEIRYMDCNLRFEDLAELFENMERISETSVILRKEDTAFAEREFRFEDLTGVLESVPRYSRIDSRGKITDNKGGGLQFEDFFELFENPQNYFQVASISSDKKNIGEKDFMPRFEDLIELFEVSHNDLTKGENVGKVLKRYTDNSLQFLEIAKNNIRSFKGKDQAEMEGNNRWPLTRPGAGVEQNGSRVRTTFLINPEDLSRNEKRGSDNHLNDGANTAADGKSSYQATAKINVEKYEKGSGATTNVLNMKSKGVSEKGDTKSTVNADTGKIINDFGINNAARVGKIENLDLSGNSRQGVKDVQNSTTNASRGETVAGGNDVSITGNNFSDMDNINSTKNSGMPNASTAEKNEASRTNEMDEIDKSKLDSTVNITTAEEGDFSSEVGGQVSKLNAQNMLVAEGINEKSGETHSNSNLGIGGAVHSKSSEATGNNAEELSSEAGIMASELSKEKNSNGGISANSVPTSYSAEVSNLNVVPEYGVESVKSQLTRREIRRLNRQKKMKELEKDTVL